MSPPDRSVCLRDRREGRVSEEPSIQEERRVNSSQYTPLLYGRFTERRRIYRKTLRHCAVQENEEKEIRSVSDWTQTWSVYFEAGT